ncbi:hypothetical protein HYV57_04760 [Candidatus Peregrinibacteria bacterium]|nr:hypothetical protein [Candidatus Peregrinibacteria bacterium]
MDNSDKHFKGQLKDEKIICTFRRHWIVIFPYLFVLVTGLFIFLLFVFLEPTLNISPLTAWYSQLLFLTLFLGITYTFHRIFVHVFNYYLNVFIITNLRIVDIDRTLFLRDRRDTFNLDMIDDVKKGREGIFQTLFNFGTLEIYLPSMNVYKRMSFIPAPNHYFRCICRIRQEYIDRGTMKHVILNPQHIQNIQEISEERDFENENAKIRAKKLDDEGL